MTSSELNFVTAIIVVQKLERWGYPERKWFRPYLGANIEQFWYNAGMSWRHEQTNKKGWTKSKLLYQYRLLHSCLIAESYIKNFMHFREPYAPCLSTPLPLAPNLIATTPPYNRFIRPSEMPKKWRTESYSSPGDRRRTTWLMFPTRIFRQWPDSLP